MRKATISFVMPVHLTVRPHETPRHPLDEFSWNLIFHYFSKIIRENSSFIKIGQEYQYAFLMISGSFILRMRNVSEKSCRENKKHTFFFSFRKSFLLWDNVEKYCRAGQGQRWKYGAWVLHTEYLRLRIHTVRMCNTHCFSLAIIVARRCLNVVLYVHCLSCWNWLWFLFSVFLILAETQIL